MMMAQMSMFGSDDQPVVSADEAARIDRQQAWSKARGRHLDALNRLRKEKAEKRKEGAAAVTLALIQNKMDKHNAGLAALKDGYE